MLSIKRYWRLWAKAIGVKEGITNNEADIVAGFRTCIVLVNLMCALVIIVYDITHW